MSRHPVDGVRGSKPRVPGVKSAAKADGKVSRAELSALNREYLAARNAQMAARAESAEILLAEKKGTLISLRLARLQLSYLLVVFRQRTLEAPAVWGPRCVDHPRRQLLKLLEERQRHFPQDLRRSRSKEASARSPGLRHTDFGGPGSLRQGSKNARPVIPTKD